MNQSDRFVSIAPHVIGVVDKGTNSGNEQLVVFGYDREAKTFHVEGKLDYSKYLHIQNSMESLADRKIAQMMLIA